MQETPKKYLKIAKNVWKKIKNDLHWIRPPLVALKVVDLTQCLKPATQIWLFSAVLGAFFGAKTCNTIPDLDLETGAKFLDLDLDQDPKNPQIFGRWSILDPLKSGV